MSRNLRFQIGEWYHCYSRGVDKRTVFQDEKDAKRFMELLYLANDSAPLRRDEISAGSTYDLFMRPRKESLVSIGAYALMPNHYHLVIKEVRDGGISSFMQKFGTAYTMYFNARHERVGNLFVKPFRARHLSDDRYFQHAIRYVHLNPAELFESGWKDGVLGSSEALHKDLLQYPYSSLVDHLGYERPVKNIIDGEVFSIAQSVNLEDLIAEAVEYYQETSSSLK